ncbi:MAG: SLBB domain-containing protein, partial [Steroidobacteraceae bacterium]
MTQFNLTPPRAWRACVWFAALAIGMAALPATAQTGGSSGLAEIYSNLPPDQQQAILQQVGGGQGGPSGQGSSGAPSAAQSRSGSAATQNNQQNARSRAADAEAMLPHRLRADDLILIEPEIQRQKLTWPATAGTGAGAAQPLTGLPAGTTGAPIVAPEVELRPEERARLSELEALIRSRNPYTLDSSGAIQLPGFAAIALAGLTEAQATLRLSAEPDLVKLDVKVTYLPVRRLGGAGLKPYGYDLFDEAQSTFAPLGDVPVPSDYIVGPGDRFSVQLYGSQNRTLALTVSRDGRLSFPELGPISVGGRRFSEVRADVESRVSRQMIGVRASLSMGDVRSIQVFVVGEARYPGAYTVSGLATVTGALFAAGGVKEIGSLRTIQLKRAGQTVRTLDLYDLLMRGDTSNDAKLLPGDAILIPPIGATVSVEGEVHRPAIYELKDSESMADAVRMAGGYTTEADQGSAALTRVNEQRRRVVLNVDLSSQASMAGMRLRNGDQLRVARLRPTLDAGVSVQGQVYRPGNYAWHEGMRLSELLPSVDELKAGADEHYVLIRRELAPDRRLVVRSADLAAALAAPGSAADVELMARDRITVFDLQTKRERVIKPLLDELQQQASQQQAPLVVNISGRVIVEGDYPLEENMKVADLIRAGGGLD